MRQLFLLYLGFLLCIVAGCAMEPSRFKSLGFEDNSYFQANKNGTR
jgi:hypothetical protein